jgi:putative two-component system response regulator
MITETQIENADAKILVIDDAPQNVQLVEGFLEWAGYTNFSSLTNSSEAFAKITEWNPDIILLDLHMPHPDGYEILRWLRTEVSVERFLPVLVFTADTTAEAKRRALEAGASDFLGKPADAWEILLRVKNFLHARKMHVELMDWNDALEERVTKRTIELSRARREALETLARAAEFRDDDTAEHTKRVGELSVKIGRELGLDDEFLDQLLLAAPLHDVGKIAIPDSILLKPGRLDLDEFNQMKSHTIIGAQVFTNIDSPLMQLAQEIALNHHERWDGSGYPNGLAGENIPVSARIVAIADVYDALTNVRPYKPAWTHDDAVAEIIRTSGSHFDPSAVEAFIRVIGAHGIDAAA